MKTRKEALSKIKETLQEITGHKIEGVHWRILQRAIEERKNQKGYDSIQSYAKRLNKDEIEWLLEKLLVKETYFFRERPHFEILKYNVLPEIRRGDLPGAIWSAGCSTGEEAYSIAFVVAGAPGIRIYGTDISKRAIEMAKEGLYRRDSLRLLNPDEISRYFIKEGEYFRVKEHFRKMVHFEVFNLLEVPVGFERNGPFGAIFLRNVLMYFLPEARERVLDKVLSLLAPGGYLFLSVTETVGFLSNRLELVIDRDTVYFRKSLVEEKVERKEPLMVTSSELSLKADRRGRSLFSYEELVEKLTEGELEELEEELTDYIEKDPFQPELHFIQSLVLEELGDYRGALLSLRRCLYLDPNFALGYWQRGRIYEILGDKLRALSEYRKAEKLLDESDTVLYRLTWFNPYYIKAFLRRKLEELQEAQPVHHG